MSQSRFVSLWLGVVTLSLRRQAAKQWLLNDIMTKAVQLYSQLGTTSTLCFSWRLSPPPDISSTILPRKRQIPKCRNVSEFSLVMSKFQYCTEPVLWAGDFVSIHGIRRLGALHKTQFQLTQMSLVTQLPQLAGTESS